MCEIFPMTAENIKRRSKERRIRFMQERNKNSKRHSRYISAIADERFCTDEEPKNDDINERDNHKLVEKLNNRLEIVI